MLSKNLAPFLTHRSKETSVATLTIYLYVAEHQDGALQSKIHKRFPINKAAAGRHIQMLVDMSLIKKEPLEDDPRLNKLTLTQAGLALYNEMIS